VPIYRVTYGFSGNGVGWTENFMLSSQQTNARAVAGTLTQVKEARRDFLAFPFRLMGCRVSAYSDGGSPATRANRSVWLDKDALPTKVNIAANAAEPNSVQYQVLGTAPSVGIPVQFQGNKNYTYLGGPADVCVTNAGQVLPAANNLGALFQIWKQQMLLTGHGWGASVKSPTLNVTGVVQNTDATLTFTTAPADLTKFTVGKTYPIRTKRFNLGRSPLNGAFNATLATATTWTTAEQVAFALAQAGGKLTPYANVLQFVPYADLTLEPVVVKHKRGKPWLSEPGRAKARVRA
jgi:hypothetical protein